MEKEIVVFDGLSELEICSHDYIEDFVCTMCGLTIESQQLEIEASDFSKSHIRVRRQQTSLEKDLDKFGLDCELKSWILENLSRAPKSVCKIATRSKILFAYAYLAHLHLKRPCNPRDLASRMGLDRAAIDEAIKIASGISPQQAHNEKTGGLTAAVVILSPETSLETLCDEMRITSPHIDSLREIVKRAIENNPLILEEDPNKVAVGIIRYYYEINGVSFTSISGRLGYTTATTRKFSLMISNAISCSRK